MKLNKEGRKRREPTFGDPKETLILSLTTMITEAEEAECSINVPVQKEYRDDGYLQRNRTGTRIITLTLKSAKWKD